MDNKNLKCEKVAFSYYAKEIGIFRRKVWEIEKVFDATAFPEESWLDDLDESAIHWIVFDEKEIIASARLGIYSSYEETPYMKLMMPYKSLLKLPIASLNRLVVQKNYRGMHIAQLLDGARVEEAQKMGAKTIVGQAVLSRIIALKNLGFEYIADIGRIKEFPNIELSLMIKQL